jgi:hypothetical protein
MKNESERLGRIFSSVLLIFNSWNMLELQDNQVSAAGPGGRVRAAGSFFTSCALAGSLLKAEAEAAKCALVGGAVLHSPACSSFDQFRNKENFGERLCAAAKSTGGGATDGDPNISGKIAAT